MMCKPEVLNMWPGRAREKSRNVVAAIALGMIAAYVATADTPANMPRVPVRTGNEQMAVRQIAALKEIVRAVNAGDAKKLCACLLAGCRNQDLRGPGSSKDAMLLKAMNRTLCGNFLARRSRSKQSGKKALSR